jgi:peptidoglycan/xylan/chitin deacetylase (PgdA/CDA1 family)
MVREPTATIVTALTREPTMTLAPALTREPTTTPVPTMIPVPTITVGTAFHSRPESLIKPQPDAFSDYRTVSVPILMYHYISVPPADADLIRLDLSVTPSEFEDQLNYLATNGFTTVSLYDVYNNLATGTPLPPKPIVLTFDDGYRDAYDNAFPLLKKYHMTGTFFIISDFSSSGNVAYMNWSMVQELSTAGMSIESHTRTHPDMRNRTDDFLLNQIQAPIEAIYTYTGLRPHFFCYPSGQWDDAVIRVLRSANTWVALTTQYGYSHSLSDAMTWTRVRIHGSTTLPEFAYLVQKG